MENFSIDSIIMDMYELVEAYFLSYEGTLQISIAILLSVIASLLSKKPKKIIDRYVSKRWDKSKLDQYNEEALIELIFPIINLSFLWLAIAIISSEAFNPILLTIIAKLYLAWVVIRFFSSMVRIPGLSKIIATIAWSVAALSIIGKLGSTVELLDSFAFSLGKIHISALTVIKGIITFSILLWIVGLISRISERKIKSIKGMTPSTRVLMIKTIKITLITLAVFIGLDSIGIDLTALTVFGGAIGLGLGFGLQKVVSNLVCGVILLLDKSVKPGDVIQVEDTYGEVNSLGARYVSVITRDGFEHLIPNENLITEKVVNWSYSDPNVRLKIPISISYDSDLHLALQLLEESAFSCSRVLKYPTPASRVIEFGDSGILLELRAWINSPGDGVVNVQSEILLDIWDKFKEKNISIPYPHRDVSITPSKELEALITKIVKMKA